MAEGSQADSNSPVAANDTFRNVRREAMMGMAFREINCG